jgi:hypothetical protein
MSWAAQGHFTNHFDFLMAVAIAWAMRKPGKQSHGL